jgi:tetratricopeptide (TPR) repeat protein
MMRRLSRSIARVALLAASFGAAAIASMPCLAEASPTVWARAREPDLHRRLSAMAKAEEMLLKYQRVHDQQLFGERFPGMETLYLNEARRILEAAGAETSRDPMLRTRLGEVLYNLQDYARAAQLFESVSRSPALHARYRAEALYALGVCYAKLERHEEEIKVYNEALSLSPFVTQRASLLANRAEAQMALGDLSSAIADYREAISLSSLHPAVMILHGVAPLWGLSVALDRSGDLETALETIRLAREYDPADRMINRRDWFFVPAYDEAWYKALGHWARARQATLGAARAEAYGSAVDAWERYIESAPADSGWVPLARARLAACERERDGSSGAGVKGKPKR